MRRTLLAAPLALFCVLAPATPSMAAPRAVDFELGVPAAGATAAAKHGARPVTRIVRPGRGFDLVGLRWRGAEAEVELRAHRAGGGWGEWVRVPHGHDHGPDDGGVRSGAGGAIHRSEPVIATRSDALQIRSSRPLTGLRLHFVDTTTPVAGKAAARRSRARATLSVAGSPPIIPRSAWGADQCRPRGAPEYGRVSLALVHHTVNANTYRPEEAAGVVLAICRFHRNSNGWEDIGYNFLVDRYGQIFEGRAGGIDQPVLGSQAAGFNSVSTGISNLGTFTDEPQTDAGMQALASIIAWKLALHGVPALGQVTERSASTGRAVTFERISGHRDANNTGCPGDALYAQLPALRDMVAGVSPPVSGLTIRANASRVLFPGTVRVSGTLVDGVGTRVPNLPVEVQHRGPLGYTTIGTALTRADGSWSLQVPAWLNLSLRAIYRGDGARAAQTSPSVTVRVAPRITARAAPRARRNRRLAILGTVAPAKPLRLVAERRTSRGWRVVGREDITPRANGTFRVTFLPEYVARYRFRVHFLGDAQYAAARSATVVVRTQNGPVRSVIPPAPPSVPVPTPPTSPTTPAPAPPGSGGVSPG